jgi:hypothetical protein
MPNDIGKSGMYFENDFVLKAWDWRFKYHSALAVEKWNVKNLRTNGKIIAYER